MSEPLWQFLDRAVALYRYFRKRDRSRADARRLAVAYAKKSAWRKPSARDIERGEELAKEHGW